MIAREICLYHENAIQENIKEYFERFYITNALK